MLDSLGNVKWFERRNKHFLLHIDTEREWQKRMKQRDPGVYRRRITINNNQQFNIMCIHIFFSCITSEWSALFYSTHSPDLNIQIVWLEMKYQSRAHSKRFYTSVIFSQLCIHLFTVSERRDTYALVHQPASFWPFVLFLYLFLSFTLWVCVCVCMCWMWAHYECV